MTDETALDDTVAEWDDVVVGAGSCGAVLAARLAENPDRRVLLLEAGTGRPAPGPLGMPVLEGYNWEHEAEIGSAADGTRRYPYRVGKALGGSSAVNGAIALRALPADFDGWAADGNPEWAWDRVLPYFVRLEADADVKSPEHGTDGPVPLQRAQPGELGTLARAFLASCEKLGLPRLADLNGSSLAGTGLVPNNALGQRRMSTADTHLAGAADHPNLAVREGCTVTRVLFEGRRATGVELLRDGRIHRIRAGRVTLCAGAVGTPAVLQRSGVGDPDRLRALGIEPVGDLPGVGENLSDHLAVNLWAAPKPGVSVEGAPWHQVMARAAVQGGEPDVNVFLADNVSTAGIPMLAPMTGGRLAATLAAVLVRPESRGSVSLRDASPDTPPAIVLHPSSCAADLDRLAAGTRLAWTILRSPEFGTNLDRVFLWTDRMVNDADMLRRALRRFVTPLWHPTGTARMGPAHDGGAVVDQYCRVHGLDGLQVADASVMPVIPSAAPHLTCVMLAERVASWLT